MDATLRVDTSPFSQLDQRFLLILFASIATHVLIATWVAHQPAPPADVDMSDPMDRFIRQAPLLPIPKLPPAPPRVARVAPSPAPLAPAPRSSGPVGPPKPAGLLGLVQGGFGDLDSGDARSAIDGARKGPVDTTVLAVPARQGETHVETIAPIVTDGAKKVGYGEALPGRGAPEIHGVMDEPAPIDPPPSLPDPDQLQRFIKAHQKALLYCYEGALKRQTTLRGKLVVRFTLNTLGRAAEVAVSDVSLNSPEVASCVRGNVQRWIFPFKPDDDFPVEFPVLFSPAQ